MPRLRSLFTAACACWFAALTAAARPVPVPLLADTTPRRVRRTR